jgi:ATP-binding cassette subfamily C protein
MDDIEEAYSKLDLAVEECLRANFGATHCGRGHIQPAPYGLGAIDTLTTAASKHSAPSLGEDNVSIEPLGKTQSQPVARDVPDAKTVEGMKIVEGDRGPLIADATGKQSHDGRGKGSNNGGGTFHKRLAPVDFNASLKAGVNAVRHNLMIVMLFTIASNVLVLAIPVYLFQISDRVFDKQINRYIDHADDRDRQCNHSTIDV